MDPEPTPDPATEWTRTLAVAGIAAIPGVGGPLAVVAQQVLEQREQGARQAGEVAIALAGDAQQLLEAVRTDRRLASLLVDVAETAARTTLEEKRRMLGVVVGRAVLDPARIDESELAAFALRDLDRPHRHCLEALVRTEDEGVSDDEKDVADAVRTKGDEYPTPVRAALIRHGCADPGTLMGGGTAVYRETPFGRFLLEQIRATARTLPE